MKNMITCLAAGLLGFSLQAADNPDGVTAVKEIVKTSEGRLLVAAETVGAFRERASEAPQEAIASLFDEGSALKWKTRVTSEFQDIALGDFFLGGILISGPADAQNAIVGIFNPWWDAILLLRGCFCDNGFRVREFYLLSGETFRGEKTDRLSAVTVIPEDKPLSFELWRVTAGTKERFQELFPTEGKATWGRLAQAFLSVDPELEFRRIALRSGIRLKQPLAIAKNAKDLAVGRHVAKMARDGNLFQLYSYFKEPNSRKLLAEFVEIPEMFRKDFALYGYVPTKAGVLYLVVNRKYPRFYVTATVPADVPKTPASFEWFDLAKSEEMLAIYAKRANKESVK